MKPEDTSPEVWQQFIELHRQMPGSKKVEIAIALTDSMLSLNEAGIRRQYPNASETEIFLRAAARRVDKETMLKVYGWYPDE